MRLFGVSVLLFLLSTAFPAEAATPSINYLKNAPAPVSMLDWGVFLLEEEVKDFTVQGHGTLSFAAYVTSRNRIFIYTKFLRTRDSRDLTYEEAKPLCRETIGRIKSYLGTDPETGRVLGGRKSAMLRFFSDGKEGAPEGLGQDLDKITVIEVRMIYKKSSATLSELKCESPLVGTRVRFIE